MQESTSISNIKKVFSPLGVLFLFLSLCLNFAWADDLDPIPNPAGPQGTEDDYRQTPYTRYGEFNEDEEEAESARFFAHGRFFGVSLGMGFQGVTGNRGVLWGGGFPQVTVKLHYWFDFNFSLFMEFFTVQHFFDEANNASSPSFVDVNVNHLGLGLKYYFDTSDLSAAVTFSNPYILVGGGNYGKTEDDSGSGTTTTENAFGFTAGIGFDFLISHKKAYFELEAKLHFIPYEDRFDPGFSGTHSIDDLTGLFYTVSGSIL